MSETVNDLRQPLSAEPANPEPQPSAEEPATSVEAQTIPEQQAAAQPSPESPSEEDEDALLLLKRRSRRKRSAASEKQTATKSRKAKREEELPDLGDGSGYVPPEFSPEESEEAHWYVIHCYSGYENKVKANLEQRIETMGMADKIFEVVVPTENEIEVREGKRRVVERRILPGYVLVRMKMSEDSWQVVRNTPGVTRFAGMGNRPQPLSPQEVEQILRRMEAEAPKIKVNFRVGQKVRITEGPFADFMGIVDKIDTERAKVIVLVSFFGRETPVELDFVQVERV